MDCDLHTYLCDTVLDSNHKRDLAIKCASGIHYIHSLKHVHRDIKPQNILINRKRQTVKIADLGLLKLKQSMDSMSLTLNNAGTLPFQSPELIDDNMYDHKSDVYAFGILLSQIIMQKYPYVDMKFKSDHQFRTQVVSGLRPTLKFDEKDIILSQLSEIARNCWNHDPKKRKSMDEIINSFKLIEVKRVMKSTVTWGCHSPRFTNLEMWTANPLKTIKIWNENPLDLIITLFYIGALKCLKRNDEAQCLLNEIDHEIQCEKHNPVVAGLLCYLNEQYSEAFGHFLGGNDSISMYFIGRMHLFQQGVTQGSPTEAVKYFLKAAVSLGYLSAYCALGFCYQYGKGVSQDMVEGAKYYRPAAYLDDSNAQFNLGACYKNGLGVTQDYIEAVKWFSKAAEQGDVDALRNLGNCFRDGHGAVQDYIQAVKWYTMASNQGDSESQLYLGDCYRDGQGVFQDSKKSVFWWQKSAEQGNSVAIQRLMKKTK